MTARKFLSLYAEAGNAIFAVVDDVVAKKKRQSFIQCP
jgi:hypothetical protein